MSTPIPTPAPTPAPAAGPALPSTTDLLRALRAPLVGLAVTFGAAVVLVLLVLAASGLDADDGGLDVQEIGVLLGMPVQLVGMALFGKLRLAEDSGIGASFLALPLTLTATYLYVTARVARTAAVAADNAGRAVLAAAVGLVTAAVLTPVAWGAAMRDDGSSIHTAGLTLFFGTWVFTAVAVLAGSRRGAGLGRPAWISTEYAEAARLWLQHVVVWIVLAAPVIALAVALNEGSWFVVLLPVWIGTLGLDSYAIGHLGGVSLFSETAHAWDFGAGWAVAFLLGAAVLTVATSVAWTIRRDHRPEWLANPASWCVLPAVYFGGALLVFLVPTITVGGGFEGLGASVSLRPSPLVLLSVAVFGLVTEALSRSLGTAIADRLSPALVTRLRGTPVAPVTAAVPVPALAPGVPVAPGGAPVPVAPRAPLSPEERARWIRLGIAAGVLVALVGGAWIAISVVNSSQYSAKATAEKYLDALAAGDLEKALDLAPVDTGEARNTLLTEEIYEAADGTITGYEIVDESSFGGMVTFTVRFEGLDGESDEGSLTLEKDGKTGVFFDNWVIGEGGLAGRVTLDLPDASGTLAVNGVEAGETRNGDYWLFPGSYQFNPYDGSRWVTAGEETTVVEPDSYGGYVNNADLEPSEEFRSAVEEQLTAYLEKCLAATTIDPEDCPNETYAYGEEQRKVVWKLAKAPEISYDGFDGTFPADLSVTSGEASVTYEYDASYGYGAKDWTPEEDTASLYLNLVVRLDGDELVAEFSDY